MTPRLVNVRHSPGLLVETSALVAILFSEPGWEEFAERILAADCATTAVNVFEASLAATRQFVTSPTDAYERVLKLTRRLSIRLASVTPEMIGHAALARQRFGRGRKGLNMGDCLSYGAARVMNLPLLYKGDDFARTDVNA